MRGLKSYEWVNGVGRSFYYDYKGRLLQTVESNHAGGTSYYNFKYDFRGNLLASQELHAFSGNATDTLTTSNSYDHRGRLRSSVTRLGGRGAQSAEAISTYAYNSLGQMAVKRLGGEADVTNYTYNIQGWLTSQASPNFTLGLRYYDPVKSASTSYFGGNIAEVEWRHSGQTPNAYSFSYDVLSRLAGANHYVGSSLTNSFTESGLSYDLNGNILSLNRSFGSGASNSYSMLYSGNQLASVNSGAAYQYDENGNTIQSGKNNLQFQYNFLNLLSRVSDATGKVAVYDWGADGLKRKVSVEGDATAGFSYLGSLVYKPNGASSYAIESVAFPEGRFVKTSSGYEVQYQLKDHLGSVRATMNQNGVLSNQSDYYPFGERWSSSSEATTNRYLFSGKEKQTAGNLQGMNLLDFGARMYDPEIPRWLTNDPLAEKYYQHTPYFYCAGNPVKYVDPNGMDWYQYGGSDPVWHNSSDPELVLNGNTYSNIGAYYTRENEDGSYTNYFQNLGFKSSKPFNAKSYILQSDQAAKYASTSSPLPQSAKGELMQALIYGAQEEFLNHPITQTVLTGLSFGIGGSGGLLSVKAGSLIARSGSAAAVAAQKGAYVVYAGYDAAGAVRYVGITNRAPALRFAEHARAIGTGREMLDYKVIKGAANLTKIDARIMEQTLINQYGLGKNGGALLNKINSVSPTYWKPLNIK